MKEQLNKVSEFHEKFLEKNKNEKPQFISKKDAALRYNLMKEENEEYLDACANDDIVEIADALGDQLYILCGTILCHGLQHKIEEVFAEIHRSNMSKLDLDGNPIFRDDGKILKGIRFVKPDIAKILKSKS